jgi:protein TonB
VLHALVLFLLPVWQEAQRRIPAPSLTAHLVAPKPPPPPPPQAEPVPAPLRPKPVARAAPQVPAPAPPILSIEPTKQTAEPALVVPAQPAAVPAPPALGANTAGPPGPVAAAPAASGLDAGAIGRFRLELMDVARRYKRYPRIAQDNNWEGRVELRVAIGQDGAISSFTVKKGAGRAVLDEEAQAMIRTAMSKVTLPPALRGAAFSMDIAVDFFLKEE